MDQAWVAVVGTVVGAVGATTAAMVAGWSARRQASTQAATQNEQWRRQLRRDSYSALLSAGAQARDELSALAAPLREGHTTEDLERLTTHLSEVRPLIKSVRLATATVFVEGPAAILGPAKRVEDELILLHTAMVATATRLAATGDGAEYLAICARQRRAAREALMDFSASARKVLDGEASQPVETVVVPVQAAPEELSWLIGALTETAGVPTLDADTVFAHTGLDSLGMLEMAARLRREYGLEIPVRWWLEMSNQTLGQIAGRLAAFRANLATLPE